MIRRLLKRGRHRPGVPDPEAFFDSLIQVKLGARYGRMDRYRDFRRAFLESPEGRRVLWQILGWCHMFRPAAVRGDANETYRREGERNVGLRILATLNAEPADEPELAAADHGDGAG